jgi:hypothetical protein
MWWTPALISVKQSTKLRSSYHQSEIILLIDRSNDNGIRKVRQKKINQKEKKSLEHLKTS